MTVWIAGRDDAKGGWEVLGVYSTEAAAVRRCSRSGTDFVGPLPLDEDAPDEVIRWPGAFRVLPDGRWYPEKMTA